MNAIDLTASPEDIALIVALAIRHSDVRDVSEPTSLDASRALNIGLPHPAEILAALTFVTVVFKTGTAGLEFLKALREELKSRGSTVVVSEPTSGETKGMLAAATSDNELGSLLEPRA